MTGRTRQQLLEPLAPPDPQWARLITPLGLNQLPTVRRVLYVEADAASRLEFAEFTRNTTYKTDIAQDSVEAISFAIEGTYDAVILDHALENSTRHSLIRQLRALQYKAAFLIAHARNDTDLSPLAEDDGIAGLIEKPWHTSDLSAALERAFELAAVRLAHTTELRLSMGNQRSALVVGSERDAELARDLLRGSPYLHRIEHATRLSDALLMLSRSSYCLILSELSLPDARGLDAIVRLQQANPDIPLIAFSGLEDDALAIQAMQAGAQDFVVKHQVSAKAFYRCIRCAMERQVSHQRLNYLASHDPLTGLANRALFSERLNLTLARAIRKGTQLAILYLDLDRFKVINDTLGHDVGDGVLQVASARLAKEVREYDTVARLGGDEFAVLVDTINGPEEAQAVAERILAAMRRPIDVEGRQLQITTSIGISAFPRDGDDAGQLLRAADAAMYKAKRSGGDTLRFYGSRRAAKSSRPPRRSRVPLRSPN